MASSEQVAMNAPDDSEKPSAAWRPTLIAMAFCAVGIGAAMHNSVETLWALWMDSDAYGHGVFVLPIVAYALWLLKDDLRVRQPTWSLFGCVVMLIGLFGWTVGTVADIEVGHQLALLTTLAGLTLAFVGWRIALLLWFPLIFPFLAVPVWDVLVPPLQEHTAIVTAWAARAFAVPVYVEGFFIAIPSGNFEIAEVCAGLRYWLAMASIAVFYAFLNGLTVWAGVAFVALALAWAVLFNWIRVTGIIMVGHWTDMQSDLVHDHYTYGWVLFAVALIPLFYVGRWFPDMLLSTGSAQHSTNGQKARLFPGVITGVAVVASALAVVSATTGRHLVLDETPVMPSKAGTWNESGDSDWRPDFPGASWEASKEYFDAESTRRITVYAAKYAGERQGAELVNSQNHLMNKDGWRTADVPTTVHLSTASGSIPLEVTWHKNLRGERVATVSVYRIDSTFVSGGLRAKLRQVLPKLKMRPAGSVLVFRFSGENEQTIESRFSPSFAALVSDLGAALD